VGLKDILAAMGMEAAFDEEKADLCGVLKCLQEWGIGYVITVLFWRLRCRKEPQVI